MCGFTTEYLDPIDYNEVREARSLCFLGFPRKKRLRITGHARRVRCLFIFSACLFVSVNIVNGHLGRPRSTHTAPTPVPMGSVHAHIITKPSRVGLAVSRSELVEPGAAKRVFNEAREAFFPLDSKGGKSSS